MADTDAARLAAIEAALSATLPSAERLGAAAALFATARSIEARREAVACALAVTVDSLKGEAPEVVGPFKALFDALLELDRGNRPALLRPAPRPHGASVSVAERRRRGAAAAAIDARMRFNGDTKPNAAAWVAARLVPTAKPAAVIKWRDHASGGAADADVDCAVFTMVCGLVDRLEREGRDGSDLGSRCVALANGWARLSGL